MIYLNLLIICLVNVLIIDLSGFINDIKQLLSRILTKSKINTTNFKIKPFDCSFCMTFWTGLTYLFFISHLTLFNLLIVLLLAFFTEPIKQILLLIKDLIIKLIDTIYGKCIDKK